MLAARRKVGDMLASINIFGWIFGWDRRDVDSSPDSRETRCADRTPEECHHDPVQGGRHMKHRFNFIHDRERSRRDGVRAVILGIVAVWLGTAAGCSSKLVTYVPVGLPAHDDVQIAGPSSEPFRDGAVAADHPQASKAGALMLARGGNAVDAAVAASFALSVVRPESCGIGGGGFMVISIPARGDAPADAWAIDYRETAPAAMGPNFYADGGRSSRDGVCAIGVPGTVAGLLTAHERWGELPRDVVMKPAITLARRGFHADAHQVDAVAAVRSRRVAMTDRRDRESTDFVWRTFCRNGKLARGDILRNDPLAHVLSAIAADGADAFYRGEIAREIATFIQECGGVITEVDLAGYEPRTMRPLRATIAGHEFLTMPPPSSGGIAIIQTLGMLDRLGVLDGQEAWNDSARMHLVAEALKHAFSDRSRFLADPDFADVPTQRLIAAVTLDALASRIDDSRTNAPLTYGTDPVDSVIPTDGGTSHISVIDSSGMAVACTETINLRFGSLAASPDLGFAFNNEMDDFTTKRGQPNAFGLQQSDDNLPSPGKRPLSSMSPTIVLNGDGTVRMVAGASGGPRIITATLQTILAVLVDDQDATTAIARPRMHHQWMPDVLFYEAEWNAGLAESGAFPLAELESRGHVVKVRDDIGHAQIVVRGVDDAGEYFHAASDPRKGGRPAGPRASREPVERIGE